jgi:hypothetical protein
MRMFSTGRRRRWSPARTAAATLAGALLLTAAFAPASMAAAPTPNEGSATVDGAIGDWSLSADFFVDMTAAGVVGRPALAKLYLKYDCDAEVLYALVLTQNGEKILQDRTDEAYINIDGSKEIDHDTGAFAWVNGDGTLADGFEGSTGLAPGSYTLRAHVLIADDSDDGYTATDSAPRFTPLEIECGGVGPTQGTPAPTQGTPAPTQGTPAPTQGTPAPTQGTPAPTQGTPAPTQGTPAPTQGTPAPTGGVAPTQAAAPGTTLPPTDTFVQGGPTSLGGARLLLALLGLGSFAALLLTRSGRKPETVEVEETETRR